MGIVGIYAIASKKSGRIYFGSSVNIKSRWVRHLWELKNGVHSNVHLQRVYDKYGKSDLNFAIIQKVEDVNKLASAEQSWVDVYLSTGAKVCVLNQTLKINFSGLYERKQGVYTEERKMVHSKMMMGNKFALGKSHPQTEEVKLRISNSLKGVPFTEERKKNISNALLKRSYSEEAITKRKKLIEYRSNQKIVNFKKPTKTKLNEDDVREIRRLYNSGVFTSELSNKFGVNKASIGKVVNWVTWKHVK